MAWTYRNTTGGHSGVSRALTVAEGDGNTLETQSRVEALEAVLATGLSITSVTYTAASFTLHFSDSSTQTIPLPTPEFNATGTWLPSHSYFRSDIVSVRGSGIYLVLQDHTSATTFDPNATDGTTENNPLYAKIGVWTDTNYDPLVSAAGSQLYSVGDLIAQYIVTRPFSIASSAPGYAYLKTPTEGAGTDPTDLAISIKKNGTAIGTVAFTVGVNVGTVTITADTDFVAQDIIAFVVTRGDDAAASDLSISLLGTRTDI